MVANYDCAVEAAKIKLESFPSIDNGIGKSFNFNSIICVLSDGKRNSLLKASEQAYQPVFLAKYTELPPQLGQSSLLNL